MNEIYERANQVLAWLGEHDVYVALVFDTLEQICWALKVLIWHSCAQRFKLQINDVSPKTLDLLVDTEEDTANSRANGPFADLSPQEIAALKKALSIVKVEFPYGLTSLTQLAEKKWGRNSIAEAIVPREGQSSKLPGFEDEMEAIIQVFEYRSYWERL